LLDLGDAVVAYDRSVLASKKRWTDQFVANRAVHPRIQLRFEGIGVAFFNLVLVLHPYPNITNVDGYNPI